MFFNTQSVWKVLFKKNPKNQKLKKKMYKKKQVG